MSFNDRNHEATALLLNVILGRRDIRIRTVEVQKMEKSPLVDGRTVVLAVYHINRHIEELGNEQFGDGNHIIYVNGAYRNDSSDIGRLMHDFRCTSSIDMYYEILKNGMNHYKETEGGRTSMCKAIEDYRNQGILEDRNQRALDSALKMIADKLPFEKIAEYTGLPLSKVQELADGKTA